jgi:hypothetical protein
MKFEKVDPDLQDQLPRLAATRSIAVPGTRRPDPQAAPWAVDDLLALQRSAGNRAVDRMLAAQTADHAVHVQRYALSHVSYTGNEFSWQAVAMRAALPQGLKNLASIKLTGMDMVTASSIPPGAKGVTPKHSEQVVWEAVESECRSGRRKIEWLYTEREPCGKGPGMKNCAGFLHGLLHSYGAQGDKTPVYYTFNYPPLSDVAVVVKQLLADGVVDNEDDAYDAAYDLWISTHGDTKAAIAEAQKSFQMPGPWGASAFSK